MGVPRMLGVITVASVTAGPLVSLAAPAATTCFGYAPEQVEITGTLRRQSFSPEPISDLFINPADIEVGEPPPESGAPPPPGAPPVATGPPPAASAATAAGTGPPPASPAAPANPPADFIGPPIPVGLLAPDPVLLNARPVPKPPVPESVWVLSLAKPICVQVDRDDLINRPEKNIKQLQLVMDKQLEAGLRPLLKDRVVIRGQLFHAILRRHYLPVLINVEDLRAPEWVQDTTQGQRPRR